MDQHQQNLQWMQRMEERLRQCSEFCQKAFGVLTFVVALITVLGFFLFLDHWQPDGKALTDDEKYWLRSTATALGSLFILAVLLGLNVRGREIALFIPKYVLILFTVSFGLLFIVIQRLLIRHYRASQRDDQHDHQP